MMNNLKSIVAKPAAGAANDLRSMLHVPRAGFGFTLVELMAVIVVIGIVSGVVIAGAGFANRSAMRARTTTTIHQVCTGLDMVRADTWFYPSDFLMSPNQTSSLSADQKVWPSESLWFWLEYERPHLQYPQQPYIVFKREQLIAGGSETKVNAKYDSAAGNYKQVVDSWGNPLNYKSYNSYSYKFTVPPAQTTPSTDPNNTEWTRPRHNTQNYDLCSYGADGTTWQARDKSFDRLQDLGLQRTAASVPPDYFFKPFNTVSSTGSGKKYSYGGEDDDDINNWRQQ